MCYKISLLLLRAHSKKIFYIFKKYFLSVKNSVIYSVAIFILG